MLLTWSGWEQSSHTNLYMCVPFIFMEKLDYMKLAYMQALQAFKEDEVPIGCVIVKDDTILSCAHNQKEKYKDATKHAEIIAIQEAVKKLNNWHLDDSELYVTLEPCLMCTGAIINSRIKKIYYACSDPKGGAIESNIKLIDIPKLNHYPEYERGLLQEECSKLLKDFFKNKR